MNENNEDCSSSQSPSLLSNLRHFRINKKIVPVHPEPSDTDNVNKTPTKTSYNNADFSPTLDIQSHNKTMISHQVLQRLKLQFSHINPLTVERTLIQCSNNQEAATTVLSKHFTGNKTTALSPHFAANSSNSSNAHITTSNSNNIHSYASNSNNTHSYASNSNNTHSYASHSNNSHTNTSNSNNTINGVKRQRVDSESSSEGMIIIRKSKKPKRKIQRQEMNDNSSDSDGGYGNDKTVYDSDEESDLTNNMNSKQKEVFEFLNTALLGELLCIRSCSQKKAEAILEHRPYKNWVDLVTKFQEKKNLGTDLLNAANVILNRREVVKKLMDKCNKFSSDLERAVRIGASNVTKQPKLLNLEMKLKKYQMVGLNWLLVLHHRGVNGILADEMGLGKTIQVIAFLAHLQTMPDRSNYGPHLIVVPPSTLDNWKNELATWCPALKVYNYYGSQAERKLMRINLAQGVEGIDIILTTYTIAATGAPEEKKMLRILKLYYVIYDEAHKLKNMKTKVYKELIKINAKHRILLTGTPLQNNLLELITLLTFVMPSVFASKQEDLECLFKKNTVKSEDNPADKVSVYEQVQISRAKEIMQPFVLRRLKNEALPDLPQKTEEVIICPMAEAQRRKYEELVSLYKQQASKRLEPMSGSTIMMNLRKQSNHPLLLRELYTVDIISKMARVLEKDMEYKEDNVNYIKEDLAVSSDFQIHTLCNLYKSINKFKLESKYILQSGKFQQLDMLLPQLKADGHRVLLFSQFVIMLDVLEEYCIIKGIKYLRFDGSTDVPIRQDLIDTYNNDPSIFVFLLSTKAGGLGINLTSADTVIIYDLDFNPQNDKQAEDRCHRMGQTKPVRVIKLLCKDSIDENIYQVALEKLSLGRELSEEENDQDEKKNVVSLLKRVLGLETRLPMLKS